MRLLWVGKGHLDNLFAGVDGGANIRLPLIAALHERSVDIDFFTFKLDHDFQPADIEFLHLEPYVESCRAKVDTIGDVDSIEHYSFKDTDVLFLEVRPGFMYTEAYQQNLLIKRALDCGVLVIAADQDLWAEHSIDRNFRDKIIVLRTAVRPLTSFPKQWFFPYYWHEVDMPDRKPEYDVVYVGNRYEREYDFAEFMKPLRSLKVLVSGDWIQKAPQIINEFPEFQWIGSTLHSYTLPLLKLGACTVHVGRKIMRQYGLTPIRPFEAYMAGRPCYIKRYDIPDFIYPDNMSPSGRVSVIVDNGKDVFNAIADGSIDEDLRTQQMLLKPFSVDAAANKLMSIIESDVNY